MKGSDIINCIVLKKGKGEITNGYSQGHTAIDLVGENYTIDDIVAHSSGTIIETQDGYSNMKGSTGSLSYGNYLRIDHHNGYETLYAHMEKGLPVKAGAIVEKGQFIGHMSDSGNAYGKHLHFEIIKNGAVVASVDAKQEGFETQLSTLLDKMEDVAILTEEEMNQDASAKVSLIEERVSTKGNEASKQ